MPAKQERGGEDTAMEAKKGATNLFEQLVELTIPTSDVPCQVRSDNFYVEKLQTERLGRWQAGSQRALHPKKLEKK
jgi:hypothetical protein